MSLPKDLFMVVIDHDLEKTGSELGEESKYLDQLRLDKESKESRTNGLSRLTITYLYILRT